MLSSLAKFNILIVCLPCFLLIALTEGASAASVSALIDTTASDNIDLPLATSHVFESSGGELAGVAENLFQPPVIHADMSRPDLAGKLVPGIPATAFLGIIGFLCITAVKDRKHWITALAGALWLTHAGITILPDLVASSQVRKDIINASGLNENFVSQSKGTARTRSEIEGTGYIRLLHYLSSIPSELCATFNNDNYQKPQPEIITISDTVAVRPSNSAVQNDQTSLIFSSAFVFSNLSRSPPDYT